MNTSRTRPAPPQRLNSFQRMLELEKLYKMERMKVSPPSSPPLKSFLTPGLSLHASSADHFQARVPPLSPPRMIPPNLDEGVFSDTTPAPERLASTEEDANALTGTCVMENHEDATEGRQPKSGAPLSPHKQVKFLAPEDGNSDNNSDDDDARSKHSSICQSPSWEGYGQRKREKKEAERRKKEKEQAEREAKTVKKRPGARLTKAIPQQQANAMNSGNSSRSQSGPFLGSDLLRPQTGGTGSFQPVIVPPPAVPSAGESAQVRTESQPNKEGFVGGIKLAREREAAVQQAIEDKSAPPSASSSADTTHRRQFVSSLSRSLRSRSRSSSAEPAPPAQTSSGQPTARRADGRPAREAMFPPSASRTPMLRRSEPSPPRSKSLLRVFRGRERKDSTTSEDESGPPPPSEGNTESILIDARSRPKTGHRRSRIQSTERATAGVADQQRLGSHDSGVTPQRSESRKSRPRRRSSITQEAKAVVMKLTGRRSSSTARSEPRPESAVVDFSVTSAGTSAFTELPMIAVGSDPLTVPYLTSPNPSGLAPKVRQIQQSDTLHVAHRSEKIKPSPRLQKNLAKNHPATGVSEGSSMSSTFDEPMDGSPLPSPGTTPSTSGADSPRDSAPWVDELHGFPLNPSGPNGSVRPELNSYRPLGKVLEPNRLRLGRKSSTLAASAKHREFPLVQAKAKPNARVQEASLGMTPGGADQNYVPNTVGTEPSAWNTTSMDADEDSHSPRASQPKKKSLNGASVPGPAGPPALSTDANAPPNPTDNVPTTSAKLLSQLRSQTQKRQGSDPPASLAAESSLSGPAPDTTTELSPMSDSQESNPRSPTHPKRWEKLNGNIHIPPPPAGDRFSNTSPRAKPGGGPKTTVWPGYPSVVDDDEPPLTDENKDLDAIRCDVKREKLQKVAPQVVNGRGKQPGEALGDSFGQPGFLGASLNNSNRASKASSASSSRSSARFASLNGSLVAPAGYTSAPTLADLINLEKLGAGNTDVPSIPELDSAPSPTPQFATHRPSASSQFGIPSTTPQLSRHRPAAGTRPAFRGGHKNHSLPSVPHRPHAPKVAGVGEGKVSPSISTNGLPAAMGGPVAKVFVECCSCHFYIDLPSKLYECMAMPDAVIQDQTLGVSGGITTLVKCPWCNHNMSTRCCAGYASVVYHTKKLH